MIDVRTEELDAAAVSSEHGDDALAALIGLSPRQKEIRDAAYAEAWLIIQKVRANG